MKFRFHVPALPHTVTNRDWNACAYTQKIRNFCRMMHSLGHDVIHYGCEGSEVPGEHVSIWSEKTRQKFFGDHPQDKYFALEWDANLDYWIDYNTCTIEEMKKRIEPRDFICLIAGVANLPVAQAFPNHMSVEYGVGYYGTFSQYCVFESHVHRAMCYGRTNRDQISFSDVVIPNYFDPDDFYLSNKEPYFFYIGRLTHLKGWHVAVDVSRDLNIPLIIAGQGGENRHGVFHVGNTPVKDVQYVGHVSIEERASLMSKALATFAPTIYIEPFGGVAVEAQLSGTPCITTDFGAFVETVEPEWRCGNHREFVAAACRAMELDHPPAGIKLRDRAIKHYSLDSVAKKYQRYFEMLYDRWGYGWYEGRYQVIPKK